MLSVPSGAQIAAAQGTDAQIAAIAQTTAIQVKIADGKLQGTKDAALGIRVFKGIPFAAPPIGMGRWKEPQPVRAWKGVRQANKFGPRAMQRPLYSDMIFRSNGMSEDCLYLNIWTPAKSRKEKLPVMVYFYGGGFATGDGSEGRYDGASMAQKGIVAVTVNYRLGVFGFFAHPELTKESPHHASGNYGLLDQNAALRWVSKNIAAFGGDPKRVTIAGESAGSSSVSAQMASPLSKGLIAAAIGESGSVLSTSVPLVKAELDGVRFASELGADLALSAAPPLASLRAIPAARLLEATAKAGAPSFRPITDGYFFPKNPAEIYAEGQQSRVPLLAGVNSEESGYSGVLGREKPTVENYRLALQRLYSQGADAVFQAYPATNEPEVMAAARDLASDRFISYNTWRWIDTATRTGGQPTYYYLFSRPRPSLQSDVKSDVNGTLSEQLHGAVHSAEIEYALGNLPYNRVYAWTADDYKISKLMQEYFANFIKTGNPNRPELPIWPRFNSGQRLVIDVNTRIEATNSLRARYDALDSLSVK